MIANAWVSYKDLLAEAATSVWRMMHVHGMQVTNPAVPFICGGSSAVRTALLSSVCQGFESSSPHRVRAW